MSEPKRIAAIRRLFIAKLDDMSSDMPHEERVEEAKNQLDKVLGPIWRDEVDHAGFGMDPTGGGCDKMEDRLKKATIEVGFSGEDVPPSVVEEEDEEEEPNKSSIIKTLMKLLHGK